MWSPELTDEMCFLAKLLLVQAGVSFDQYEITLFEVDVEQIHIVNYGKDYYLKVKKEINYETE